MRFAPRVTSGLIHGLLACLLTVVTAQAQVPVDPRPPGKWPAPPVLPLRQSPLIVTPAGQLPIRLVQVNIDGEVRGSLVESQVELSFLNPNPRTLEGELQFPLRETQTLSGFALEMADGTMMPAVPVPRATGRQAFEDTIRQRVDPALLEQTEGQRFRLRLYPLNSGQPRRVRLLISETLRADSHGAQLRLPLDFGTTVPEALAVHLRLPQVPAGQLQTGLAIAGASVRTESGQTLLDFSSQDFHLPASGLAADTVRWPLAIRDTVATDRSEGQSWFHVELAAPDLPRPREKPAQVVLIWDASASGGARDHAREFQLLERLFRWQVRTRVVLRVVRDAAEPERSFEVRGGDWHALRRVLEDLPYDGASNAGLWQVGKLSGPGPGLALLFSDGLGNWGESVTPGDGDVTAYAVLSSRGANAAWLRQWAEARQGRLLDLGLLDPQTALDSLSHRAAQLLRVDGEGFEQLVLESRFPEAGHLRLAGRFNAARAQLDLVWQGAEGSERHQQIELAAPLAAADRAPGFAARRWATLKLAELQADASLHRAEIASLGQRFGLVSSETSLVVLENLSDYQRFGIMPPAGPLRARYQALRQDREAEQQHQRSRHLEELVQRYRDYAAWWERDFPRDTPRRLLPKSGGAERSPSPVPATLPSDGAELAQSAKRSGEARMRMAPMADAPMAAMAFAPAGAPAGASDAPAAVSADVGPEIAVELAAWSPDTENQRRLRDAEPSARYAVYLDERAQAARSPAFFLDAAQVFQAQGDVPLALRILSNLAELDAGNRSLLRVLAYRLQQFGQSDEAVRQLRRVAELAPDEPQSWRDLGLAQAAAGHPQQAVDALWRAASGVWSPRFADIDLIALTELDAIAAAHAGLDLSAVDARLRRNLPLDIRVALAWDADNTDVDLWVEDPNGEWTSYQNPLSYQGGHVSRDCTQGYGPEVFSLKAAKPGHYEVRAHYYGSRQQTVAGYPTLLLHLTQGFGTAHESSRDVLVRLEQVKDELLIGSFDVGTSRQDPGH